MKKIALIGLSSFGISVIKTLSKQGVEIIAIDIDEKKINDIKEYVTLPLMMDATKKENLLSVEIDKIETVIVSAGPTLEPSILIVNIKKLIPSSKRSSNINDSNSSFSKVPDFW